MTISLRVCACIYALLGSELVRVQSSGLDFERASAGDGGQARGVAEDPCCESGPARQETQGPSSLSDTKQCAVTTVGDTPNHRRADLRQTTHRLTAVRLRWQAVITKRLKARAAAGGAAKKPAKKKKQQPPPPAQTPPQPQAAITVDSAVELSLAEYASGLVRAAIDAPCEAK